MEIHGRMHKHLVTICVFLEWLIMTYCLYRSALFVYDFCNFCAYRKLAIQTLACLHVSLKHSGLKTISAKCKKLRSLKKSLNLAELGWTKLIFFELNSFFWIFLNLCQNFVGIFLSALALKAARSALQKSSSVKERTRKAVGGTVVGLPEVETKEMHLAPFFLAFCYFLNQCFCRKGWKGTKSDLSLTWFKNHSQICFFFLAHLLSAGRGQCAEAEMRRRTRQNWTYGFCFKISWNTDQLYLQGIAVSRKMTRGGACLPFWFCFVLFCLFCSFKVQSVSELPDFFVWKRAQDAQDGEVVWNKNHAHVANDRKATPIKNSKSHIRAKVFPGWRTCKNL
jgi:hypothetical protein